MSVSFETTPWIWRNGEFIPWEDATLHVMSHVVHYGTSVFEGIRCYETARGPGIFRLKEHMRRFIDSARIYRMELGYSQAELEQACCQVVTRNQMRECYLRPVAFRGYGSIGVNPAPAPMDTYIICWPWGAYLGTDALEKGVAVGVSSWHRAAPNTFPSIAKAGGNYINAGLIKMEAQLNGFAEGIALGPGGLVSEGSGQNVFVVLDGILFTPALDGTLLAGITRDTVIHLAREAGYEVVERPIPRELLYTADELFFTGTAAEVTPICLVDHIPIGGGEVGPITRQLQQVYLKLVRGEREDPHGWLTYPG